MVMPKPPRESQERTLRFLMVSQTPGLVKMMDGTVETWNTLGGFQVEPVFALQGMLDKLTVWQMLSSSTTVCTRLC